MTIFNNFGDINVCNISVLKQVWHNGASFSFEKQARSRYGICYVFSGEIKYKTAEKELCARKGDIALLRKNAHYKALFNSDDTIDILINFDCFSSFGYLNEYDFAENEIVILKNRIASEKYFSDALKYYFADNRPYMLKSAIFCILDNLCNTETNSKTLKRIKHIIDSDANFDLSEPELAEKCFISVSTFQRLFKKLYGKTFSEYKNDTKISKAKELLVTENYSIEEISETLGFCDSAYFSKRFKQTTGLSPKQYLKQYYTM